LWLCISTMGLPGAALAWTLRVTINCVILFIVSGCWPHNLWRVVPAILLMAASLAIAQLVPLTMIAAAAAAILAGLTFAILGYALDPTLRETIRSACRRFGFLSPTVLPRRDVA
jgi:hypothetical protein